MCIELKHCGACVERGTQQDVVDFEQLKTHVLPSINDAGLHWTTKARRNDTIRRAALRSDPIVLSVPEIAHIVHTNRTKSWYIGGYYDRYQKATSREGYEPFGTMAARFGVNMGPNTPAKKKSRRNRIRTTHDRNLKVMNILLFAFEYGYDPIELSVAVNREEPSSPILSPTNGRKEASYELPLAA